MAYELKTKKNEGSVDEYIAAVEPDEKRKDSEALLKMMREITGDDGAM